MLFRQLFDPETSTYTYLLADPDMKEAILIDPVREHVDRDATLLSELGLRLVATLETHVHADHVTGAWLLKQRTGSDIIYPVASGVEGADRMVGEGDGIAFGRFGVEVRLTPGHTSGCASYITHDRRKVFTGDALLIHGSGRTDFQQGDARQLYRSVWDQVLSLPDDTEIYPGHDYKGRTVSTVREEKLYNPRLGQDHTEDDFVATMSALKLAYPKRIDVALPANMALGNPDHESLAPRSDDPWDHVKRSASGAPHVSCGWVERHQHTVRIVDVRQPHELEGPLGCMNGAELVPLDDLAAAAVMWDREAPIVLICRSSGRSDRAALALESQGFRRVASMVGGMLAWTQEHAPTAPKSTPLAHTSA